MAGTGDAAYEWADRISLCSAAVLGYRFRNRDTLSESDALAMEKLEDKLDSMVVVLRNQGITAEIEQSDAALTQFNAATKRIQSFLKSLDDTKRAVSIGLAVVAVAQAVITGEPAGLVTAVAGLSDVLRAA